MLYSKTYHIILILSYRYNLVTGEYPFEGDNVYRLFEAIGKCNIKIPSYVTEPLRSLLVGMLKKDPKKRFTLRTIQTHP